MLLVNLAALVIGTGCIVACNVSKYDREKEQLRRVTIFIFVVCMGNILFSIHRFLSGTEQPSELFFVVYIILAGIAINDLLYMIIPNSLILTGIITLLLINLQFGTPDDVMEPVFGGLIGFSIYLVIYILSRSKLGAGDVKLGFLIGMFAGQKYIFIAVIVSSIAGFLTAIILLILKKKTFPYGPSMCLGALAAFYISNFFK